MACRCYLLVVEIRGTHRAKVCLQEDSAITRYDYGNGVSRYVAFGCMEYVGVVVANEKNNVRGFMVASRVGEVRRVIVGGH